MMNMENIFRFIGLVLVLACFSISVAFRHQADQSGDDISDKEEGLMILSLRKVFGLGMWLAVLIYFINPQWIAWGQYAIPTGFRWLAVAVMAACVPLFYWIFSSLGTNITKTVVIRREHQLVTKGPYRWIRHPLYSFGFAFFISLSVMAANWFMLIIMLLCFAVLSARNPIEETKLVERFGDEYRGYMEQTGRYFPKFRKLQE